MGEEVGAKVGLERLTGRNSLRLLTAPVAGSAPSVFGFCGTSLVGDLLRSLLAVESLLFRCIQSATLGVVSLRRSDLINNRLTERLVPLERGHLVDHFALPDWEFGY